MPSEPGDLDRELARPEPVGERPAHRGGGCQDTGGVGQLVEGEAQAALAVVNFTVGLQPMGKILK